MHGESMIVQVYEIQTAEEARLMIDLGVDHIGTVLLPEEQLHSSRLKAVVDTVQAAGRKSSLIPLFSDTDRIARTIDFYRPDIIHFCEALPWGGRNQHGVLDETVKRQTWVRQAFPWIEIMRTIPIYKDDAGKEAVLEMAALFAPISDWFLTDTLLHTGSDQEQPVSGFVGITGETCSWYTARKLVESSPVPVILAGGIGPENVRAAVRQVQPAGVDSCTRTNAFDGDGKPVRFRKDPGKVAALVHAVRNSG
jgi:phosphoribosylanthranilate isomerase